MKNGTVSVFGDAIERTDKERAHLIKLLQDSQIEYLSYVENVSEAQWNWKPGQDRWSVGETAEHILLAEGRLFSAMERAVAAPPNPDWEKSTAGKAELLERALLDRSRRAVSPESIRPQGLSKAEVICKFKEARAKTIKFVQDTQIPLKEHNSEHPFPVFNTLNAYQWLLYISLHNLRHDEQIAEVKATPGYPGKLSTVQQAAGTAWLATASIPMTLAARDQLLAKEIPFTTVTPVPKYIRTTHGKSARLLVMN